MCGISRRNVSPAPAPRARYSAYTTAPLPAPSRAPTHYSTSAYPPAPISTYPPTSSYPPAPSSYSVNPALVPLPISVTHTPSASRSSLVSHASRSSASAGYPSNYVSCRGRNYHTGSPALQGSAQPTPQLVYSSSSTSSSRRSSMYSTRDISPRGSFYGVGDELLVRPVTRESRASFCASPVEEREMWKWRGEVGVWENAEKERRGALSGSVTPVGGYPGERGRGLGLGY